MAAYFIAAAYFCTLTNAAELRAEDLLQPCRIKGFAQQVQCGQIQRPLNPDAPAGKQISLHFIVLPAQDKNKAPDPVFLLAGGPGQSAINVASWIQHVFEKLQRRHDLIFVDQRGTGSSAPLNCPEMNADDLDGLGVADYEVTQALKCKQQLQKLPYGDLRFFTTSIAMQDLDAVRAALQYSTINLIGVSYGTRAALEYARQFPGNVRRSVLDGVVRPDQMVDNDDLQKALNALFDDCAKEARCHKAYPALPQEWKKLLAGLPKKVSVVHPRLGRAMTVTVSRNDVLGWVTKIMYSPVSSAGLPSAIYQATQGYVTPLIALSGSGNLAGPGRIAGGMHLSVVCSEAYSSRFQTRKSGKENDFGDAQDQLYMKVCMQWPQGKVPDAFYTIQAARTPVLLLSGGLDPVTPPWQAARVAKALGPLSRQIVLDNAGHGLLQQTCVSDVVAQFINTKTEQEALNVDASCMKPIARPVVWIAPAG